MGIRCSNPDGTKAHDIAIKKFGNLSELYPWIASPIKQWLVEGKPTEEVHLVG